MPLNVIITYKFTHRKTRERFFSLRVFLRFFSISFSFCDSFNDSASAKLSTAMAKKTLSRI